MRTTTIRVAVAVGLSSAFLLGLARTPAHAQRGLCDPKGMACRVVKREVVSVTGKLIEIRTSLPEATSGRSTAGIHLIVETAAGKKLDVHLGPAAAVADRAAKLTVGQDLTLEGIRSDSMKTEDLVARSITSGDIRIELRDEEFRPVWAGGNPVARGPEGGQGRFGTGRGMRRGQGAADFSGCCGMCPAGRGGGGGIGTAQPGVGRGHMGMSADEHDNVFDLLSGHASITHKVEEISGGVKTTTRTSSPELVETLRAHVRQMARHLEEGQPVRMWDPVFRDIFGHHDEIRLVAKDVEGGIEVTETSQNPEVVPLIRAHAKKVAAFVAEGHAAARPPWAGMGRGMMMRRR